jgi:hypothetical protein
MDEIVDIKMEKLEEPAIGQMNATARHNMDIK